MGYIGEVIHGRGEAGTTYALPTANIYVDTAEEGVFVGRTKYLSMWYPSLICVRKSGPRKVMESHLFDFAGSLYNQLIEIEIDRKLRDLVPFENREQMHAMIKKDVAEARLLLNLIK